MRRLEGRGGGGAATRRLAIGPRSCLRPNLPSIRWRFGGGMWCNGPPTLGGGLLPPTPIGLGKGGGGALLDDGIPDERIGENGWGAMGNVE